MNKLNNCIVRSAKTLEEINFGYELAQKTFGPNYFDSGNSKGLIRQLEPIIDFRDTIIALNDSMVIGFARILNRTLNTIIGSVDVGGISSVCIHPDFRGCGLGVKIMNAALKRQQQRQDVFSFLFARKAVDGWYTKMGYVGIGSHINLEVLNPKQVQSALPQPNLESITGIYEKWQNKYKVCYDDSYKEIFWSFGRPMEKGSNFVKRVLLRIQNNDFISVIKNNNPIGYFVLKNNRVIELAAIRKYEKFVLAEVLKYVGTNCPLVVSLPLEHWATKYLKAFNYSLSQRQSWDGGHMIRLLPSNKLIEIISGSNKLSKFQDIEKYCKSHPLMDHENARNCLYALVGKYEITKKGECIIKTFPNQEKILQTLPTWNLLDEC